MESRESRSDIEGVLVPNGGAGNGSGAAAATASAPAIAIRLPRPIVPPIDWGAIGRGAAAIGGRAAGVAGGLLFPSNGLWNTKPGECYGTLTCAARPVYNEVDDVIDGLTVDGTNKGNHVEVDNRGGNQADDFGRIVGASGSSERPIDTSYGLGSVVDLPGGGTASTRPGSSTGPGTIQIDRPGRPPIKIRY